MLVLFETAAGYAFFKLLDNNKLEQSENLYRDFATPENAHEVISLNHFYKFEDTTEALSAITATVEGKLCKSLKKALKKYCETQEQIAVADVKLGNAIKDKLGLKCVNNTAVQELMRGIRSQLDSLLVGLPKKDLTAMRLGLAHSLSRYKLKFSPDKVDIMVIQAVNLLDELDKELNNYMMRCREWYGWHFPELSKLIPDNMAYVKTVLVVGLRENIEKCDLSDILPEEIEQRVREAAEISMGTEISEEDATFAQHLCNEIIQLSDYRSQLYEYLKARMMALAPNLSILVGEVVGARLMSHAGSLVNLAKHPASTVQILGAEKALFRALKMKKDTPKYGLIYHASLIGQSSKKNKGKMSRMLAAKASLATRFDALGENTSFDLGAEHKQKLEARLRFLEAGNIRKISGSVTAKAKFKKYNSKNEYAQYPTSIDSTLQKESVQKEAKPLIEAVECKESQQDDEEVDKKKKKKKKHSVGVKTEETEEMTVVQEEAEIKTEPTDVQRKKKKKRSLMMTTENVGESSSMQEAQTETEPTNVQKKKKRKHSSSMITTEDVGGESYAVQEAQTEQIDVQKKKKKKYSSSIVATENVGESSGVQEVQAEAEPIDVQKKKKKKRDSSVIATTDIGEPSTVQEAQIEMKPTDVQKKKKKKHSSSMIATEDAEQTISVQEAQIETEPIDTSKKKKKKKRSSMIATEDVGESSGVQQAQVEAQPTEVAEVPKKKKKKVSS